MVICCFFLSKVDARDKYKMWRTHTCVAMDISYSSVAIQSLTHPCHNKRAVLSSVVGPSVTFSIFQPYWGHMTRLWMNRAQSRCNDYYDSVIYGPATQTSITVVSKFSRKTWGAVSSGYQALLSTHFRSAWEWGYSTEPFSWNIYKE